MGAWGYKAWDNDRAADWFGGVFSPLEIDKHITEAIIREYDHDSIRAAAYLLTTLGASSYVWPGNLDLLDQHVDGAIKRLSAMLNPEEKAHQALCEMWGARSPLFEEIQKELSALKETHRKA